MLVNFSMIAPVHEFGVKYITIVIFHNSNGRMQAGNYTSQCGCSFEVREPTSVHILEHVEDLVSNDRIK